jgi:hypothetical protein
MAARQNWSAIKARAPVCQPHAIQSALLTRNSQNPARRRPRLRDATHHAAATVTNMAGHCSQSRKVTRNPPSFPLEPTGWSRVQAICDFVNQHVTFGYAYARSTKTAWETYCEHQGVCRDFAHLAITFCRCLNIPARYSTGYLGDIGVPPVNAPMDFAGAMEVYLGGAWHTFDPRNNARRIGRLWVAHGSGCG